MREWSIQQLIIDGADVDYCDDVSYYTTGNFLQSNFSFLKADSQYDATMFMQLFIMQKFT